jgi:hypothetical protein
MPVLNATALAPSIAPSHAAEALGRPTIWEVPFDSHVRRANQRGIQPAAAPARSPALRSLRALAGRIAHDPASIERRRTVRAGRAGTDPALSERLRRFFAPVETRVDEPVVDDFADSLGPIVYSSASAAAVYHAIPCTLGARIQPANRVIAASAAVPASLRPCKVCLPVAA